MEKNTYYDYFKKNTKGISFRTFPDIKKKLLKFLSDENCPKEVKLMIGSFFLKTIYMMLKFRGKDKEDLCDNLKTPITETENVIIKGEYLHYHDVEAMSLIALHFYMNRFKGGKKYFVLQLINDTQLIKGYLQRSDVNNKVLLGHFIEWITKIKNEEQRSNILDVLLRYFEKDERVQKIYKSMRFKEGESEGYFNDAQNAHDKEISEACMEAAENLLDWCDNVLGIDPTSHYDGETETSDKERAETYLYKYFEDEDSRIAIQCVLERCSIENASFGIGFTIADIFYTTLKYIQHTKRDEEILAILMEEMDAMKELCASGYIMRCISVLQGQHPDGLFDITIPFYKKLYGLLSSYISKKIQDGVSENIVLGTIDPDYKKDYLQFIETTVNEYLLTAEDPGEDVEDNIIRVLEKLTDTPPGKESVWQIQKESKKLKIILKF